jgi:hypothetical protein
MFSYEVTATYLPIEPIAGAPVLTKATMYVDAASAESAREYFVRYVYNKTGVVPNAQVLLLNEPALISFETGPA